MAVIAILAHHAGDLINFRGAFVADLVKKGETVLCFAPDYTDASWQHIVKLGAVPVRYSLNRTGMNPLRDAIDLVRLVFLLRRHNPDLVFAFSIKPVIYGTLAAWLAGVQRRVALIEGAGYVFTDSGTRRGLLKRGLRQLVETLYRFALAKAHRVIFLNPDDRAEFIQHGLVRPAQAELLGPIGVDLDEWSEHPLPVPPVTFILVARLLREKGVAEYIQAARQVKQQHPQARFVLLGRIDSNPGGFTQAEVTSWVDQGVVEWPGHVAVQPWLKQASVFVLPSYREGVPRSTQEAMAMGRPIITTDAPGCRETIQDGVNGFRVPVRDADALAQAMLKFVRQPDLIEPMGRASRKLAEAIFDVKKINSRLADLIKH